jgi:hypothetical protein
MARKRDKTVFSPDRAADDPSRPPSMSAARKLRTPSEIRQGKLSDRTNIRRAIERGTCRRSFTRAAIDRALDDGPDRMPAAARM